MVGTVLDSTGAAVPSATVTARQAQTGKTTSVISNATGSYVFPSLPPAEYSLSVSAAGFQNYQQTGIVLQADQSATVDITLHVGGSSQTVTVQSNAAQVDTSTGTLSQVIDASRVNDLPLNGRNAAQLTTLVPGVVAAPNDGGDQGQTKTFPVAVTISANGSRADQTNYMLDGGNNVDEYTNVNGPFPFPDALQEFSVQTSNYNAEYGQNAGGVVNIITKSGGSRFHGDVFEYVRNGALNARNYFASTVDPLKRNQFGGTLGGPLLIPHLTNGKRTFFFFGYQGTTLRDQEGGQTAFVPTQDNLQGDFSALLSASNPANPLGEAVTVVDPVTNSPFPDNRLPLDRLDPAALAVSKDLPVASGNGQVFFQKPVIQTFNEYLGRVDRDLSANDHMFAHYYYNDFDNAGILNTSNLLTYSDQANIRFQSALISETHIFSTNLLNNLVVNYSREISVRGPVGNAPDAASFGVNIYQPAQKSIQLIAASGFFTIGDNPQATFQRNNYTFADDLHWVHGNHNIAFGAHVELSKVDINSDYNAPGLFTFNSDTTNYGLASFLLGYLYQFSQGNGQYLNDRNQFDGFYAQDSWKMTNRFTLNYGLRYEPFFPWSELKHRIEQFSPAAYAAGVTSTVYPNAPKGLLFPGDPGVPEQGVRNTLTNFMPRLGFALDVSGDGKTSLRGGAGMFYDTRQPGILNSSMADATPFSIAETLTQPKGSFSNPYLGIVNPFPAPVTPSASTVFPSPVTAYTYSPTGNFNVPVIYDWNLTLEQQITGNMFFRIAYVGSHSTHLYSSPDLNPAVYVPGSTLSTDQRRRYQGFSSIAEANMGGNAHFDSLQATLQRRLSGGLTVLANYTFSKTLDDLPPGEGVSEPNPGQSFVYPVYFPNYKALDQGPPDFDRRNVFSGSYVWQIPNLKSGASLLRKLTSDWQTTGILQAESGTSFTVTAGEDRSQTGLNKDRAMFTGEPVYGSGACHTSAPCVNYLNPMAFALPALGTFGDVPKGALVGPGYFDWDAGLIRKIPLNDNVLLMFRAEYFNILNRANFGNPQASVSAGGFGSITSANDPRIAQLALKLTF